MIFKSRKWLQSILGLHMKVLNGGYCDSNGILCTQRWGQVSAVASVLLWSAVIVKILQFLPETGSQEPIPIECCCHQTHSAPPLKLSVAFGLALPVSLSADCRAWQTGNFMPVKSDPPENTVFWLDIVTAQLMFSLPVCAVPDTGSSLGSTGCWSWSASGSCLWPRGVLTGSGLRLDRIRIFHADHWSRIQQCNNTILTKKIPAVFLFCKRQFLSIKVSFNNVLANYWKILSCREMLSFKWCRSKLEIN